MRRVFAAVLAAAMTLATVQCANAQAVPLKYDSAASTNATEVVIGKALLKVLVPINTTTTLYYLKFYDVAVAPTCNTSIVVFKLPVPFGAANAGGGVAVPLGDGLQFQNGIGFCLTGGFADNDATVAATGVSISLGVKQ